MSDQPPLKIVVSMEGGCIEGAVHNRPDLPPIEVVFVERASESDYSWEEQQKFKIRSGPFKGKLVCSHHLATSGTPLDEVFKAAQVREDCLNGLTE